MSRELACAVVVGVAAACYVICTAVWFVCGLYTPWPDIRSQRYFLLSLLIAFICATMAVFVLPVMAYLTGSIVIVILSVTFYLLECLWLGVERTNNLSLIAIVLALAAMCLTAVLIALAILYDTEDSNRQIQTDLFRVFFGLLCFVSLNTWVNDFGYYIFYARVSSARRPRQVFAKRSVSRSKLLL